MKIINLIVSAVAIMGVSGADKWIAPNGSWVIAANGSPGESVHAQLTSWASRCVTAEDRATVEAKCETYKSDMAEDKVQKFVEDCVQKYCDMVELRAGCGKNCEAATFPGTREECEANNPYREPCKHYRLGWRLGGLDDAPMSEGVVSLIPRLVKLSSPLYDTKWLLLPYVGFRSKSVSMEYQETDLWIPDRGAIYEAWLYFDIDGTYSKLKAAPSRFHAMLDASFLRVIPVGEDLVTDIGFLEGACDEDTGISCKATTIATRRKWYDLVNPAPVCRGFGEEKMQINGNSDRSTDPSPILCNWWREDFYYGNFVPSWRERTEMVLVNAIRTDAKKAFTTLYDMSKEEAVDFIDQCESPGYPRFVWDQETLAFSTTSFWAPPFYYNSFASEGTRLWAYELAKNTTYVPAYNEFNGTDIYSRVEAHTGTYCPGDRTRDWRTDTPCGRFWPVSASGGQKTSGTGAVGVVGEAPFRGNCDHYRALMDPHRTMAAVGLYPSEDWDIKNPTEGYTDPVYMFFDGHSHIPYSNEFFLTYQPIPSGTHMLIDDDPDGPEIRFMAQYHTTRPGLHAYSFEVVVNGVAHTLEYFSEGRSKTSGGASYSLATYTVDVNHRFSGNRFGSLLEYGCLSYYFRATNKRGSFTLPQSGKYVFRTYGWKGCMESYAPSDEEVDGDFGSSCGYPGRSCPPTESECGASRLKFRQTECLNAGCSYEVRSGDCALSVSTDEEAEGDDDSSTSGCRFSVLASLVVSLIVALM